MYSHNIRIGCFGPRRQQLLPSHHEHDDDDYTIWFQWADMARAQLQRRNNLLDSYVDPLVEHHMTLKRKDCSGTTLAGHGDSKLNSETDKEKFEEEEKVTLPPRLIRRSPRKLLSTPSPATTAQCPRIVTADATPRGSSRLLVEHATTTATKTPVVSASQEKKSKPTVPECSLWPKLEDLERAFAGCCLENSDALWNSSTQRTTILGQRKSRRSLNTSPLSNRTGPSCSHDGQQPFPSANEKHQPVPSIVRVSTSTVLGQQTDIYRQIQLERQEEYHHPRAVTMKTMSESPKSRHELKHCSSNQDSRPTNKNNECSSSPQRTKQQIELRHLPQALHNVVTVEFTKPTKKNYDNQQNQNHSSSRTVRRPGVTQYYQVPEQITVPCLECQAPLKISKTAPTRPTGVYCRNCGVMASSELMRSMIGSAAASSSHPPANAGL